MIVISSFFLVRVCVCAHVCARTCMCVCTRIGDEADWYLSQRSMYRCLSVLRVSSEKGPWAWSGMSPIPQFTLLIRSYWLGRYTHTHTDTHMNTVNTHKMTTRNPKQTRMYCLFYKQRERKEERKNFKVQMPWNSSHYVWVPLPCVKHEFSGVACAIKNITLEWGTDHCAKLAVTLSSKSLLILFPVFADLSAHASMSAPWLLSRNTWEKI